MKQPNQNQKPKSYALADLVLRMVLKRDDRLKLHPRAKEGFQRAIDALFAQTALDPKEELEAVVRLVGVFQRDEEIELADGIIDLLADEQRALSVLGISSGRSTREAKARFAKLVSGGKTQQLAAPVFGKAAPAGSLKVSSFLTPGADLKRRATPRQPVAASSSRLVRQRS